MLLRIRGPDGMVRLELGQDDTFGDLGNLVRKLPDDRLPPIQHPD